MSDFAQPDLEIFAMREAAKHCGPLGARLVGKVVLQEICHLNNVTEPTLMLNKPISVVHLLQNMRRNFPGLESVTALVLLLDASATAETENWW